MLSSLYTDIAIW